MDQKTERGFTLVEIIVALLVLVIGLLAMTSTSALVTRMAGDAFRRTMVAELVASRIEIIRSRAGCIGEIGRDSTRYADLTWNQCPWVTWREFASLRPRAVPLAVFV